MADLGGTFDASNAPQMEERSALPAGEYKAQIVKGERRQSKAKPQNSFVELEFEIVEGAAQGRRFWTMLNLWNDNQTAQEIAQRELSSICHAVGKLRVSNTDELVGRPMLVKLKVEKTDRGEQNRPTAYRALSAPTGAFGAPAGTNAAAAAPSGAPAARGPWA